MTLKEIERIIDEADYVGYPKLSKMIEFYPICSKEREKEEYRHANDNHYVSYYEDGEVRYYYKLNKDTGELNLLAKIDHIDKEKKIIRKKIKDLNQNEVDKVCNHSYSCNDCPLCILEDSNYYCLIPLILDKNKVKNLMETEIEIEVEE